MGQTIGIILVITFIALIGFFVIKELKGEGNVIKLPKELKPVLIIGGALFIIIIALLIYTNFFTAVHYNYK